LKLQLQHDHELQSVMFRFLIYNTDNLHPHVKQKEFELPVTLQKHRIYTNI